MKSFLIGSAVGVAATLLVQQLLPGRDAPPAPVAVETTRSDASPAAAPPATARGGNPSASAAPVAASMPPSLAIAKPAPAVAVPVSAPPLPPLQLSDEHASLLNAPSVPMPQQLTPQQMYARFLAEGQDPNWSFATAQALRDYVANHKHRAEFDLRNVECRQTACVITLFGNLPTSDRRWSELLMEARTQPWWVGFSGSSVTTREVNGRSAIAAILTRTPPQPPTP